MLITLALAVLSCTFSIIGFCNMSKLGTSEPCCKGCAPGCLTGCNGMLVIFDFIALVFAGVLFGEVMHLIGLFAVCFILEIVAYIIMILMCAIAAILLLVNKQKWAQAISPLQQPATGIEIQPTPQALVQPQQGVIAQPQPVVLQGAIVHAAPLQQAKPTLDTPVL